MLLLSHVVFLHILWHLGHQLSLEDTVLLWLISEVQGEIWVHFDQAWTFWIVSNLKSLEASLKDVWPMVKNCHAAKVLSTILITLVVQFRLCYSSEQALVVLTPISALLEEDQVPRVLSLIDELQHGL